jgi:hypothetical protein
VAGSDFSKPCALCGELKQDIHRKPFGCGMNFRDRQLQKYYDQSLSEASNVSKDLGPIQALIAMQDVFQMFEGPHSARVHETLEHLLSAQMRPGLRRWYQRPGAQTDPAEVEFRDQLNQLTGERLEIAVEISRNPS